MRGKGIHYDEITPADLLDIEDNVVRKSVVENKVVPLDTNVNITISGMYTREAYLEHFLTGIVKHASNINEAVTITLNNVTLDYTPQLIEKENFKSLEGYLDPTTETDRLKQTQALQEEEDEEYKELCKAIKDNSPIGGYSNTIRRPTIKTK